MSVSTGETKHYVTQVWLLFRLAYKTVARCDIVASVNIILYVVV